MMKVYFVRPITGLSADEVFDYYTQMRDIFSDMGYEPLIPMAGKKSLRTEESFKGEGYTKDPLTTDDAIFGRDRSMVGRADILFVNLTGAKRVSIGSMFEMAWASELRKQIVLVMEEGNVHQHAFVKKAATIIYPNEEDAISYMRMLIGNEM